MVSTINAIAFATVLTAGFTLRFRVWREPIKVLLYFSFFVILEVLAHRYAMPEIAFGIELAYVCFSLAFALVLVMIGLDRYEKTVQRNQREPGKIESVD